jgi:hypothetical protein
MKVANRCDKCARERATLYEVDESLVCLFCLPASWLSGAGALRAIKSSVTGLVNIERRRRSIRRV